MDYLNPGKGEFWVAVSFFLFLGLLVYLGVFRKLAEVLDARAAEIRRQLEEARRLREEAQAILEDYKRKQRDAQREADDIIAQAKRDAESHAREAQAAFQDMLKRRTKLAEDKIARAEAQVIDEVRNRSVDLAIAAAERLIAAKLPDETARNLIGEGVKSIGSKLN